MSLRDILIFFLMITVFEIYVMLIFFSKYSILAETWPLNNIVFETFVFFLIISILPKYIFRNLKASIVLAYSIIVISIIYIPLLKYSNDLWLYGPWDSSAHYSFSKWIVENGYIPNQYELYYSGEYGYHPGNGILPAFLNLVSKIDPLTVPMSTVLAASYVTYALLLSRAALQRSEKSVSYFRVLLLLTLFTLFSPYYGGGGIAYAFVAILVFILIKILIQQSSFTMSHILIIILTYMGLLATHLSTAVILLFFIYVLSTFLFLALIIWKKLIVSLKKKFVIITITILLLFITYEIYVDVYLAGQTMKQGIQRLIEFYIAELRLAMRYTEYNPYITISDLIIYLVSQYTKHMIIIVSIAVYVIYRLLTVRKSRASYQEYILLILLISSLSTWLIGWFGVGHFMSGSRALPLIQFIFSINIIHIQYKSQRNNSYNSIKNLAMLLSFGSMISFGTILNYSIHIGPYIKDVTGEEIFTYSVLTQGNIPNFILKSITFLNEYLDKNSDYKFLCVQPYIGFGLCDLLWGKPKMPTHGFISPKLTTTEAMIELLNKFTNVVIPMPTTDRVVPGPIGYTSFYCKPLNYLIFQGNGIIFSTPYYLLAIK
ncbi:MAG: hypothetical protein QXL96_10995 [Ignisphaera sp.]